LKKIAAIDIGSNAIRMLICYVINNNDINIFQKNQYIRLPLRLGEDSFRDGEISKKKIDTLSNAIISFKYTMKVHDVSEYQIYATSALRDSKNSKEVISCVYKSTGMKIKLINGTKEAKVISMGNPIEKLDFDKTYVYIDVGGGSTEFSIVVRGQNKKSKSFNIGTVRLINNLVDLKVFDDIKKWIYSNIDSDLKIKLLATGGNINKIHEMTRTKKGSPISFLSLKDLYNSLKVLNFNDRMIKYDLNPDRADVILPALKIFISTMEWTSSNKLFVPQVGLVDGMINEIFYKKNGEKLDS
jgi:exopolyphosphatase/guanosine-5'-triphosphate,3'-diphosphate pyrophosphatase